VTGTVRPGSPGTPHRPDSSRQPGPLAVVGALVHSGLLRPRPPVRALHVGRAALRYGLGPGCGPVAGAAFCAGAAALVDDTGTTTFGQLEERCEALADGLAAKLGPGGAIALLGRNSAAFYQVMVAASRCGLDILYLNTGFPAAQIAELAGQGVAAIVHDAEFADRIPPGVRAIPMTGAHGLSIERLTGAARRPGPGPAGQTRQRPGHRPRWRRSRHVILTSGTTGQPKRAARTGGDARSIVALTAGLPYRARETHLIAAPMFHSWGWLNTLLTMLYSSTVVVTRSFDPAGALALIERERCQVLVAVPVMLRRIIDLPPEDRGRYDTSSLRAVMVSGSSLSPALAGAFMDEFGDVLYNLYGSTEAAYATVASPADLRAAPGTAGRPLPGVEVRVLGGPDAGGSPQVPGAIWVRGPESLADARAGSPASRGRAAVPTGDLGWFDADGRLFVSGRADDMIIAGGENVYPVEVENALEQHPAVLEAAVTGVEDTEYGQVLAAHLVLRRGQAVAPGELRSWCLQRLAPFQVPRRFLVHDSLPHNMSGKVVKSALDPGDDVAARGGHDDHL
jgi:acyl-CoA synthetase (AMP-forming)/AMP-acid ligase II